MSQGADGSGGGTVNVLDEAKRRPKLMTAGVTAASVIGFFFAWDKLSPTLEFTVKLRNAPIVADAAMEKANEAYQKATESREWIDKYIEDQKTQREFDQKLAEQAAEYQRQMLELQRQQQQPSQMQTIPNLPVPPQTPIRVYWEKTEDGEWFCTDGRESWWPNEDTGACE